LPAIDLGARHDLGGSGADPQAPALSCPAAPGAVVVGSAIPTEGNDSAIADAPTKPAAHKIAAVVVMLGTDTGAGMTDLQAATGWQPHTVRAAISRLRQGGLAIVTDRRAGGGTIYRIDHPGAIGASGDGASTSVAPTEG
jgi:Protein of unknown function (DUF3489)